MNELILANWQELLIAIMGIVAIIVRITPTRKDNDIFNFVKRIIDALIPNNKKGGGKF